MSSLSDGDDFSRSIKDVLRKPVMRPLACASCGSAMVYYDFRFWLSGEDDSWTVPVGFCADCDGLPAVGRDAVA